MAARDEEELSPEKTEQLLHFRDLTGIDDIDRCREYLTAHNWDIESAAQARFAEVEGEPDSPSNDLGYHHSPLHPARGAERAPGGARTQPRVNDVRMPFVNLHPPDQRVFVVHRRPIGIMGWGYWIISFPFHFFYSKLFSLLRFAYRLLRPDPRALLTDPLGDVRSFVENFEQTYGPLHPAFFVGTYNQALSEAKKELKFLLVYLHGDNHQDTPTFCREVLCVQSVVELIDTRMLFWACSTNSPEGYRVSQALRENSYPFLALIVLRRNHMTLVARLEGALDRDTLETRLTQMMDANEGCLIEAQADRQERSTTRSIIQQQDEAYQQSLLADQQKERAKREALERKEQEERAAQELVDQEQRRAEEVQRRKEQLRDELPPEPPSDDPDAVRILLKLPNGCRLERRFNRHEPITHLYNYVYVHEAAPDDFQIVKNFPRCVIPCQPPAPDHAGGGPTPPSFLDVGLANAELLFVHDNEA